MLLISRKIDYAGVNVALNLRELCVGKIYKRCIFLSLRINLESKKIIYTLYISFVVYVFRRGWILKYFFSSFVASWRSSKIILLKNHTSFMCNGDCSGVMWRELKTRNVQCGEIRVQFETHWKPKFFRNL